VTFAELSRDELKFMSQSGERSTRPGPTEFRAAPDVLFRAIDGCYFNVVGYPLARLQRWCANLAGRHDLSIPINGGAYRPSTQIPHGVRFDRRLTSSLRWPESKPEPKEATPACLRGSLRSAVHAFLKLRIPSPRPRITSGIFLPPNKSTTMANTTSQ